MSSILHRRENVRDATLIAIALVALIAEILFLLHQTRLIDLPFAQREDPRGTMIGEVVDKKYTLRQRAEQSLSWFPLASGDRIYLNDTLLTGPKAWARLKFHDEGTLDLEGDTLVRFSIQRAEDAAKKVLNLEIGQGVVRVKSKEIPVQVRVKTREIRLTANSEIILSQPTMTNQAQIQVKQGEAQVVPVREIASPPEPSASPSAATTSQAAPTESDAPTSLKSGEALQFDQANRVARVETNLNVDARYPLPQARIIAKGAVEKMAIYWAGDEGDTLELSQDSEFLDARQYRTSGRSAQVELSPGKYYWRVRRDVAMSNGKEFTLMPPVLYRLTSPGDGAAFKQGVPLAVGWETVDGAAGYNLEVSSTKDFAELVFQKELSTTKQALPALEPGTYFWRIRASHAQYGAWPPSATYSFIVKRHLRAPKPKGGKVLPDKSSSIPRKTGFSWLDLVVPRAWAEEDALYVEFSWEGADGAASYRLEVSSDPKFQQMLRTIEQAGTTAALELPRLPKYYWRVAARDDERILHAFSAVQEMEATAVRPKPSPEVVAKILATQSEGLTPKKKEEPIASPSLARTPSAAPTPAPGNSPAPVVAESPREVTSVPKDVTLYEEAPRLRVVKERRLPVWAPQGAAFGGGGALTEQLGEGNSTKLRNQGTLALLYASLFRWRTDSSWELSLARRQTYVSAGGGARAPLDAYTGEFLYRGIVPFLGGKLTAGAQFRQDLDLRRLTAESAGITRFNYYPLLLGLNWESASLEQISYGLDLLAEGAAWGDWKGAGLWARARLQYELTFLPVTPEIQLNLHPFAQWYGPENRRQLSADLSVILLLRLRWDGSAESSATATGTKPGT